MIEYKYDRTNIPNPLKLDSDSQPNIIILSKEIETEFPAKKFKLFCNSTSLIVKFEESLDEAGESKLDQIIIDYENYGSS